MPLKCLFIQFADGTSIHKSSTDFQYVYHCILSDFGCIQSLCSQNNFQNSLSKTEYIFYSQKYLQIFVLLFENQFIKLGPVIRFLEMLFVTKLLCRNHFEKVIHIWSGSTCESHSPSLFKFYRTLIRSRIDYGCQIYDSFSMTIKHI